MHASRPLRRGHGSVRNIQSLNVGLRSQTDSRPGCETDPVVVAAGLQDQDTVAGLADSPGLATMGTASDPLAVGRDERLRLIGLAGLRVVDASVMADDYLGEYQYPTAMIAEKGAAMILEDSRT